MHPIEPEPWSLGVRLRDEPQGVHRFAIRPGAPADGRSIAELGELPEEARISFVVRDSDLVLVRGSTRLRAGDDVLVLGDAECAARLSAIFEGP